MKIGQKNYLVKLYDKTYTTLIGLIADARIDGFTANINAGFGQMDFTLERSLADWNDAALSQFALNEVVELWVQDMDTGGSQVLIYSGYISNIHIINSATTKSVGVSCLGFVSKLSQDIYKDGTTSTVVHTTDDPSDIFKAIIDKLRDPANGNLPYLNYVVTGTPSIETTGLSVTYSFKSLTYLEALEQVRKLSPSFWFWYIGADKYIYFKAKPATPTHNLGMGNIDTLDINYGMEEIKNGVLIWDKSTNYRYLQESASVALYGRRIQRITDANATGTNAMDKEALQEIGKNKDPHPTITIKVADNNEWENINSLAGYDIESFKVGDTVSISGVSVASSAGILTPNMTIVRIQYYPQYAVLDLELSQKDISDHMLEIKKDKDNVEKVDIPTSYTAV